MNSSSQLLSGLVTDLLKMTGGAYFEMSTILENGRIFFLGAGFSAGAGLPLTNTLLPLAAKMFKAESPGLFQRISWWADSADVNLNGAPDAEQFARFCTFLDFMELREFAGGERWSDEGSRERVALKFYLAKAIALATPSPTDLPDYYIEFAKNLRPGDVVVSFNWDTLLEGILEHLQTPYSYTGSLEAVEIHKLHGSVNWAQKQPLFVRENDPYVYEALGVGENLAGQEVYCCSRLTQADEWRDCRCMVDGVWPLLVLPGYGKAVDTRLLSTLWYRPEMLNIRGGGAAIIGLSVAEDDYIMDGLFRYLFRNTFGSDRKIKIVNPDTGALKKFQSLAGAGRDVDLICSKFDETSLLAVLSRT